MDLLDLIINSSASISVCSISDEVISLTFNSVLVAMVASGNPSRAKTT